ncbi:uncharacterized protein LOC144129599 [Amblyomma americanum]
MTLPSQPETEKSASAPRQLWRERETSLLIHLWEDHLADLRRQKRNGGVHEEIARGLCEARYIWTRAQVQNKIENLGQTYRSAGRGAPNDTLIITALFFIFLSHSPFHKTFRSWLRRTTGSGAITWEYFWRIHQFLGSLPANDPSSAQESAIVEEIILRMEHGETTKTATTTSQMEESLPCDDPDTGSLQPTPPPPAGTPAAASSADTPATLSAATPAALSAATTPAAKPPSRKRERGMSALAEVHTGLLEEQKLLRQTLQAARNREYDHRERHCSAREIS